MPMTTAPASPNQSDSPGAPAPAPGGPEVRRRYAPLPITSVVFAGGFWGPRLSVNRERTIPHVYRQSKQTGRIDAFLPDWSPAPEVVARAAWGGSLVMFWDSDVAKWLEAACYSLATHPDPELDEQL